MKDKIEFSEFLEIEKKLEIRMGHITKAEEIPNSYGLKLTVSFEPEGTLTDESSFGSETAFTNLGKTHKSEDLVGKTCPFIMNLKPSVIKGVTSTVMIMVSDLNGELTVDKNSYKVGSKLL